MCDKFNYLIWTGKRDSEQMAYLKLKVCFAMSNIKSMSSPYSQDRTKQNCTSRGPSTQYRIQTLISQPLNSNNNHAQSLNTIAPF